MGTKHKKPKSFDYNIITIGAGSAGLVTSYIAAAVKAKVALIEKNKMGGDCLNTGCVPSKALIKSASLVSQIRRATSYGLNTMEPNFNLGLIMKRVQRVISTIEPHDSVERYTKLGVECFQGEAKIESPWEVSVNGKTLTTKNIVVATGARPLVPKLPGLESVPYSTTETLWDLKTAPERMLVLGGGPIGVELSQCFARLGVQVILVEQAERILSKEDPLVAETLTPILQKEGVEILTGHKAHSFSKEGRAFKLKTESAQGGKEVLFDHALIAVGRKANVTGFGLEELGVELDEKERIQSDPFLRTNFKNIFVCGDVTGDLQFTHTASHEAWYASANALFSPFKMKTDYRVIPRATFSDPEVAHVGLTEEEAKSKGLAFDVTHYGIDDLDRAITEEEARGFVKVLTAKGKDRILGVTIVGLHASDCLAEFVLAMKHGLGLSKILGTIHIYPTMAEANKYAAGNWQKARAPEWGLKWLERFHNWRRK